ncbi:hypothetical protein Ddye_016037, partial [Dipteronia dyeriana]
SSIWDALTGSNNNVREAVVATLRGMSLFRQGDVLGSLVEFDKAIELDPRQKECMFVVNFMVVGRDPQPVMRGAYNMFKDGGDPEKLVAEFSSGPVNSTAILLYMPGFIMNLRPSMKSGIADRYSTTILYLQKEAEAKLRILAASKSPYGQGPEFRTYPHYFSSSIRQHFLSISWVSYFRSDDYMASLAKVHSLCRGWNTG